MSKKTIATLIGIIVVLGGGIFVLYLFLFAEDPGDFVEELRNSFPFGREAPVEENGDPVGEEDDDEDDVSDEDHALREISRYPSVEDGAFAFTRDGNTYVRYISRNKGDLYEVSIDGTGHRELLTEEEGLFPGVYRALWINENTVILFISDNGSTNIVAVEFSEGEDSVTWSGTNFPSSTIDIALSPNKESLFYLVENEENVLGYRQTVNDAVSGSGMGEHVYASPIRDWIIEWPSQNMVTLTTKASGGVGGHMYTLNPHTGSQTHALRNINGLVTRTNTEGEYTIYNENTESGADTIMYDHVSRTHSPVDDLATLVDKCAWEQEGLVICARPTTLSAHTYPDMWYQGKTGFRDSFFEVMDANTGFLATLFVPTDENPSASVDAINITFDPQGRYIIFNNRNSGHIWSYDLGSADAFGDDIERSIIQEREEYDEREVLEFDNPKE